MTFEVKVEKSSVFLNGEKLKRKYSEGCRKIFLNDNFVVKVEWKYDRNGLGQCQHENYLWKKIIQKKHRKFFVPILKYKHTKEYDYVIQPRIKFRLSNNEEKLLKYWEETVGEITSQYRIDDLYSDLGRNWGFVQDSPIIFDYGV